MPPKNVGKSGSAGITHMQVTEGVFEDQVTWLHHWPSFWLTHVWP